MSRIILSNDLNAFKNIVDNISKSGFKLSKEIEEQYNLAVFKKWKIDNYNFYQNENNWVATCGTFIYGEKLGEEALSLFIEDAKHKSIKELREKCVGCYFVLYKINQYIYGFIDETQTFKFHYYAKNDKYLITNDLFHIYLEKQQELCNEAIITSSHIANFTSSETQFVDTKRLLANEYLEINLGNNELAIKKTELNYYHYDFNDENEAISMVIEEINKQAEIRKKIFNSFSLFMTGGADSRVILGTYLANKTKPNLINMVSNNWVLPTLKSDTTISNKIAKYFNLKFFAKHLKSDFFMDYYNVKLQDYWKEGQFITIYGNNSKYKEMIFENIDTEFVDFGYFGELIKDLPNMDEVYFSPFSLNDFVSKLFFNSKNPNCYIVNLDKVRIYLYNLFLDYANENNMNIDNLSKDDCFKLWSYRRTIVDINQCLISNLVQYSYPILSQKRIYDLLLQIPYKWKLNTHFQLSLLNKLCPELCDFQFFCHCAPYDYDKTNNTLTLSKNVQEDYKELRSNTNNIINQWILNEINPLLTKINCYIDENSINFFSLGPFLYFYRLLLFKLPSLKTNSIVVSNIGILKIIKFKFTVNRLYYIFILNKFIGIFSRIYKYKKECRWGRNV